MAGFGNLLMAVIRASDLAVASGPLRFCETCESDGTPVSLLAAAFSPQAPIWPIRRQPPQILLQLAPFLQFSETSPETLNV
ncbi:hypothetical protein M9458_016880, partial [Cirrhinus mrigala]